MVRDRWHFAAPPFAGSLEPATFYCGGPQDEALARLEWLLKQRQRCGLVTGDEGFGKSHLATMAVRRLAGLGAETVLLSLRGLAAGDWLDLLLARLPLDPASRAEPLRPWQKLENRLRENTLMERPTVIIVDDLDHATDDCLDGLARIIGAAEPLFSRTVVVALASSSGASRIPDAIRSRAAVRVELTPWEEADVAGFLARSLERVGGPSDLFSAEAVGTISRFALGVPRVVCQLAHLATVVAAGEQRHQIDAAVIEGVWRELTPAAVSTMPSRRDDVDTDAAAQPRVRVVRKLWG
jgi:type II secretory pathway predicted ATPase ExeA